MSRALERARGEVTKARRDVDRWTQALDEAIRGAAEAEAAEPADPGDLERVAAAAAKAQARVGAARRAHAAAVTRLHAARPTALLAEAADEEAAASRAEGEARQIEAKVSDLLDRLEEVDGVRYLEPTEELSGVRERVRQGETVVVPPPSKRADLHAKAIEHRMRAAVLRFTARHGRLPGANIELDYQQPGSLASGQVHGEFLPDAARDYVVTSDPSRAGGVAIG